MHMFVYLGSGELYQNSPILLICLQFVSNPDLSVGHSQKSETLYIDSHVMASSFYLAGVLCLPVLHSRKAFNGMNTLS